MVTNKEELISLIRQDQWMMDILFTARSLNLPDWWICAGFVRSKIWDSLHHFNERTPIPDIDVIFFDPSCKSETKEKDLEKKLGIRMPGIPWSVKNETRMHVKSNMSPYSSSVDAMSKFPETATALGVKIDEKEHLILAAPCGIEDVIHLTVRPTPVFLETKERMEIYRVRVARKNWKAIWPDIKIYYE